jgi:hypothetical protein
MGSIKLKSAVEHHNQLAIEILEKLGNTFPEESQIEQVEQFLTQQSLLNPS